MDIRKGLCRLKLRSGLVAFGFVQEVNKDSIRFLEFDPSATSKNIPISSIEEAEPYEEENIPPYE